MDPKLSVYDERPWRARYRGQPDDYTREFDNVLDMFRAGVERDPEAVAVKYFDGVISRAELDAQSDALASALIARGFVAGDRLAVYLQNVPQFLIAMVGSWKAGGFTVSINPMNRQRELTYILQDCGAKALLALESIYGDVGHEVVPSSSVQIVLTTSELDYQTRSDPRLFTGVTRQRHRGTEDFLKVLDEHRGEVPPRATLAPDDIAFLTYTSGTTGVPKGAMNTHGNVVSNSQLYRDWLSLRPDGAIMGAAPLFHVTGLVGHISASLLTPMPLILTYRFDAQVVLDAIREHRPTFIAGAISVFNALVQAEGFVKDDFSSFTAAVSGGAPISPASERSFFEATGHHLHNSYGLTETTSSVTFTPLDAPSPVDPVSGAFSVGVPTPNVILRIVEDGHDVPLGRVGEIVVEGPQVVPGYWGKPEETEANMPGGQLKTGDVGFMDEDGWVFLIDRKKDMINASGYKVWPREVEDVLAEHPAVRESAVVGVPDEKRGETVRAFVSLRHGATATPEELIAHCKERMAAYKYPRTVVLLDEVPKTATGKVLRRELRKHT